MLRLNFSNHLFFPALLRVVGMCAVSFSMLLPTSVGATQIEIALGQLLLDHPMIKAAEKTIESSRSSVDSAQAGFYPTVNLASDSGPQHIDNPTTRTNGSDYSRTKHTTTLTVNQNLFDGNLTTSLVRTAQLNTETSSLQLEFTRQNTLFQGISSYIDVLRQKRLVDLGLENIDNIQKQLNLEDERVRRGSGITVDVLEAKSRLQIAKERLVSFEGALIDAMTRYNQIFGHMPDIDTMQDPWPPISLIPNSLEDAIEIALHENISINGSSTFIELAREQRRSAASELYPTIDLEGAANFEKNNDTTIGIRRDYTLLLKASWDLFSGYSTPADMEKADFDYRTKIDEHEFLERGVKEKVHLAWQALLTTRTRTSLLENAVNIASEVHTSRAKLREIGNETIINVLDAQNQVTSAQINYTTTAYSERLATYQLILEMGRLTPENLNLPQP